LLLFKKPTANISAFKDPRVAVVEIISLREFVRRVGQARVARALGVKPASIAKALKMRRNIHVTVGDDGVCVAQEIRPFPSNGPEQLDAEQLKSSDAA
jgi:hypothetical protein